MGTIQYIVCRGMVAGGRMVSSALGISGHDDVNIMDPCDHVFDAHVLSCLVIPTSGLRTFQDMPSCGSET